MYRKYPAEVVEYVKIIAENKKKSDIAKQVNAKFGINLSKANIKSIFQYYKISSTLTGHFENSHIPWNPKGGLQSTSNLTLINSSLCNLLVNLSSMLNERNV